MSLSWSSPCNYEECGKPASIIEAGEPRCRSHTAPRLKLITLENAKKQERLLREEKRRKRAADAYARSHEKAWEKVRTGARVNVFVGISGRKRAFNLCSRCNERTQSGISEKDPALRFCVTHMPANVALHKAELAAGYARSSSCSSDGSRARKCKVRGNLIQEEAAVMLPRKCLLTTTDCFDASRKWAIALVRCRTRAPKKPSPRPEDRAASP